MICRRIGVTSASHCLHLEIPDRECNVKAEIRIFAYAVFLGLCIWVIDGLFFRRFMDGSSFIGAVLLEAPAHRIYLRGLVLLCLAVFGWVMASVLSRQRRAEEQLRTVKNRLELILGSAHEGIFGLDLDGHFTFVNEAAADILGYECREMMGRDAHGLIHHSYPDGRPYPPEECPIFASEADEPVRVTDEVMWDADGESIPVHYSATRIIDKGEPRGTVVVFRRIDQDELAKQELQRLRRLSELILTWAGEGIFGVDTRGRITFANPAAAVMFGYEAEELPGREVHPLIQHTRADGRPHPEDQSLIYAAFEDDDVYHVSDEIFWRSNGESFPVEYTSTPLRENGEVTGAVVVFRDITERKLAEKDLRETMRELARSNRELEQFAYIVSHDLQEPLRMVRSYVELLQRRYTDQLDRDAEEFIEFAVDGAARMQRMIEALLSYSRVGSRGGEFGPVDLTDVVDEALANVHAAVEESGAKIDVDALPTVWADRAQMVQLLQNLIGNAIKFRDDVPPRVEITARSRGGEAVVSVSDNGIGIPAEQRENIFGIFHRNDTAQERPGTGIGLAICKKIVERHNGSIWVESELGVGSVFYLTIPLCPAETA